MLMIVSVAETNGLAPDNRVTGRLNQVEHVV
jgi:hypothetical protein